MADATDGAAGEAEPISVEDALGVAMQLHRTGQAQAAEAVYRAVLRAEPDHADTLHFLGLLLHQIGRSAEGVALIERSLATNGANPSALNNLANIQVGQGRFEEAVAVYRKAIALDPEHRDAHDNLGKLLAVLGRLDEAIQAHVRALELDPQNLETRRILVSAYAGRDERGKALALLHAWLEGDPTDPTARHLQAAISGESAPERANDDYVRNLFDGFASSFDRALGRIGYRAPELVVSALTAAGLETSAPPVILDAGCGTGLCGPLLAPIAGRLVGIDLSPRMLDRARERGVYHELAETELTAYLRGHPGGFEAIVSADTLCYFGDLRAVIAAASFALCPNGLLVFTVEKCVDLGAFRLHPHGRYSHSAEHVRAALDAAGLQLLRLDEQVLRSELGRPVEGYVATAVRPAPSEA